MTTIVTDMNNEKVEENNNEKKIKALENTISAPENKKKIRQLNI